MNTLLGFELLPELKRINEYTPTGKTSGQQWLSDHCNAHGVNLADPDACLIFQRPFTETQWQALLAAGGKLWQKGGFHRLYLQPSFIGLRRGGETGWTLPGTTPQKAFEMQVHLQNAYIDLDEKRIYNANAELQRRIQETVDDICNTYQ